MDGAVVSYPGADGGEVGGSSRRERYSVPGTALLCPSFSPFDVFSSVKKIFLIISIHG